jgi:hypothetical protein
MTIRPLTVVTSLSPYNAYASEDLMQAGYFVLKKLFRELLRLRYGEVPGLMWAAFVGLPKDMAVEKILEQQGFLFGAVSEFSRVSSCQGEVVTGVVVSPAALRVVASSWQQLRSELHSAHIRLEELREQIKEAEEKLTTASTRRKKRNRATRAKKTA